jgi:hypothetical protein
MLNARQIKKYVKTLNLEHKSRVDTHLALYLLDLESVSLIYEKYKDQIEIIESPLNETQKEVMLDDLNVIVKEKLFYNKYRYKINFGFRRNDVLILNTLFETCNDSLGLENYKYASNFLYYKNILDKIGTPTPGQQIGRLPYYGTASIYFKEYEDVCTFHFLFKNNIAKTHKIVLKKELDE